MQDRFTCTTKMSLKTKHSHILAHIEVDSRSVVAWRNSPSGPQARRIITRRERAKRDQQEITWIMAAFAEIVGTHG
jgi:hypothetical protein